MKIFTKHIKLFYGVSVLFICALMISCTDTTSPKVNESSAPPTLSRVSLVSKDSTTTLGNRGQQYVIYGKHLEGARKVLFNDSLADVKPSLVTSDNIITAVPGGAPYSSENTPDSLTVITNAGQASLPFKIAQPPATLDNFTPKYAEAGDTVTITGDVFVNVNSVKFGEKDAQIISSSATQLKVKVPDGVSMIPKDVDSNSNTIQVTTPAGTASFDRPFGFKFKVYDDALTSFYNGSYSVNTNLTSTEHVAGGKYAIKAEYTAGFGALLVGYYGSTPDLSPYSTLKFSIYGGMNAGMVRVFLVDDDQYKVTLDLVQGEYKTFYVPLDELGNPATINQLQIQTTGDLFNIWVDNIGFY